MIRRTVLSLLGAAALLISSVPAMAQEAGAPPETGFDSYVVMNSDTGQVLVEKNMNKREFPASITKIMTGMLALENGNLEDEIEISPEAVFSIDPGSTHIALTHGEIVTMEQALYATLMVSANDAANVLAEYVGGTLEDFAVMMNEKAQELGAVNTHFTNAHGLPDNDHYTTAYDMALITQAALDVPGFREVFGATEYHMPPTNKQPEERNFGTYHHMIVQSEYYYPYATGGKLGWTEEANHTIVTLAEKDGVELICVGMNTTSRYGKYTDTAALFDYCFDNFVPVTLSADQMEGFSVPVLENGVILYEAQIPAEQSVSFLLHKSLTAEDLSLSYQVPEEYEGEDGIAPTLTLSVGEGNGSMYGDIGVFPLTYHLEATAPPPDSASRHQEQSMLSRVLTVCKWAALGLLGLAALFFLVLVVLRYINRFKARRRQKLRREQRREALPPSSSREGFPVASLPVSPEGVSRTAKGHPRELP